MGRKSKTHQTHITIQVYYRSHAARVTLIYLRRYLCCQKTGRGLATSLIYLLLVCFRFLNSLVFEEAQAKKG